MREGQNMHAAARRSWRHSTAEEKGACKRYTTRGGWVQCLTLPGAGHVSCWFYSTPHPQVRVCGVGVAASGTALLLGGVGGGRRRWGRRRKKRGVQRGMRKAHRSGELSNAEIAHARWRRWRQWRRRRRRRLRQNRRALARMKDPALMCWNLCYVP
jgi:hypothetical protein